MNEIVKKVRAFAQENELFAPGQRLCAAVSGGADSMTLLCLMRPLAEEKGIALTVCHVNHGLRGETADRDEAFVRDWCAAREIPFFAGRGDVRAFAEKTGRTVEEAARQLRYKFLEETRRREGFGCILTAHHADDSAETMLLNLLRGTGLKGLTGIPEKRDCILRPLLSVTRAELAAYAAEHRIPFVEDSTNGTDDAARNVLRHQVLPVLKKLNPRVVENMSRTASLLAADEAALDAACRKLLVQCAVTPNVSGTVPLAMLQDAPEALRGRLVLAVLAGAVVLALLCGVLGWMRLNVLRRRNQIHRHENLRMVIRRKERTEGPVDEPRYEYFAVRRTCLPFQEAARITAGSGVFLFIFHRKRHEIHVRLGVFGCDHGRQEHRIPLFDHDRTVGLLGKFSRRDGNLAVIPQRNDLRRLFVHHHIFYPPKMSYPIKAKAITV